MYTVKGSILHSFDFFTNFREFGSDLLIAKGLNFFQREIYLVIRTYNFTLKVNLYETLFTHTLTSLKTK